MTYDSRDGDFILPSDESSVTIQDGIRYLLVDVECLGELFTQCGNCKRKTNTVNISAQVFSSDNLVLFISFSFSVYLFTGWRRYSSLQMFSL